jgi:hypothetical protein
MHTYQYATITPGPSKLKKIAADTHLSTAATTTAAMDLEDAATDTVGLKELIHVKTKKGLSSMQTQINRLTEKSNRTGPKNSHKGAAGKQKGSQLNKQGNKQGKNQKAGAASNASNKNNGSNGNKQNQTSKSNTRKKKKK